MYTRLSYEEMSKYAESNATLPRVPLDTPRLSGFRFPRLAEMYQRLPCQFLHISVPMSVPKQDVLLPKFDHFSTQLSLTSHTDAKLTSVTTVYSHGKMVLSLVEPLEPPRLLSSGKRKGSGLLTSPVDAQGLLGTPTVSTAVKEEFLDVPQVSTPGCMTPSGSPNLGSGSPSARHRYIHQAPFATDFWADFLSRNHPVHVYRGQGARQSFCKEPSERAALGLEVSGVTIIQELVDAGSNNGQNGNGARGSPDQARVSPGSTVGDVVLVVAWELECVESLAGKPGVPTVALISEPSSHVSPMMGGQQHLAPPQQQFMGYSMGNGSQQQQHSPLIQRNSTFLQAIQNNQASFMNDSNSSPGGPSLLRKRGLSSAKPNLMLNIPSATPVNPNRTAGNSPLVSPNPMAWGALHPGAAAMMGPGTPLTPANGLAGTPLAPPPMPSDEEAKAHRERLNRAWAASAASQGNNVHGFVTSPLPGGTFSLPMSATASPLSGQNSNAPWNMTPGADQYSFYSGQQQQQQPQRQGSQHLQPPRPYHHHQVQQHQQQDFTASPFSSSSDGSFSFVGAGGNEAAASSLGLSFGDEFPSSSTSPSMLTGNSSSSSSTSRSSSTSAGMGMGSTTVTADADTRQYINDM